jgi:hypothetical protein
MGIACGYLLVARLDLPAYAMAVPVTLIVAGVAFAAVVNLRGRLVPRTPWIALVGLGVTYVCVVSLVMPALDQRKVVSDIGRWVVARRQVGAESPRVGSYHFPNPAFRFYVGQHVTFLDEPVQARAFFNQPGPFYCLMRKETFDEFVTEGVPLRIAYERSGVSVTSGRTLWRSRPPDTRFVLATRDH